MKKKMFITAVAFIAVLAVVAVYLFRPNGSEAENHVDVHIDGTSIIYNGPMAAEGVEQVKKLYTENIDRLVLNSRAEKLTSAWI